MAFRRKAAIALVRLMNEGEPGSAAGEETADITDKSEEALGGEQLKEESGDADTGGAGVEVAAGAGKGNGAERHDAVEHEGGNAEGGGGLGTR